MNFSNRLIELRTEKGLTQKDFGNRLNITRSTIASYEKENREPKYDILVTIADFFNVSIDYLLGHTNIRNLNIATTPTPILSDYQQELLKLGNALNTHNQIALLERAQTLLDLQKENEPGIYKKDA